MVKNPGISTALDQWRGLALLLVLVSHGFFFTHRVEGLGRVGVNLFFFISGILVFRSLNRSTQERAALTLSFWQRRFLRLFPAMVVYLAAMIPIVYLFQDRPGLFPHSDLELYLRKLPPALFYMVDYDPHSPTWTNHLWSVAVEMKFFLLAPLIFLAGGTSPRRRAAVWISLLVILMAIGAMEPWRGYREEYQFHTTVWPMMLGFLAEYGKGWISPLSPSLLLALIRVGEGLLALTLLLMVFSAKKSLVIALGSTSLAPCFLCYVTNRSVPSVAGRTLAWLGERTYSIYLWQQPLTLCGYLPNLLHPLGAALSVAVGAVSYRLFEHPFLSAKRK
jgi:peptidoglycan/LPS O-acetylase OafA/YrhL